MSNHQRVNKTTPQTTQPSGLEGDAGGTKRDETHEVRCRPMVHNVDRLTTENTKCELTTKRLVDTNCPRLESTPGEGDASYRSIDWSAERHTSGRTLSVSGMNCCRVRWPYCRQINCMQQYNEMTLQYVLRLIVRQT